MTKNPDYPMLSEAGALEAEQVIEHAKRALQRVCEEALSKIYVDIPTYIESDSWQNFRNEMMDGFKDYGWAKLRNAYDFKQIRSKIYADFREEIIKDLDQDNLAKIADLEKEIIHLRELIQRNR